MVEFQAIKEGNVLPVTYNRFDFGTIRALDDIGLDYHLRNLCRLTTAALIMALDAQPNRRSRLAAKERRVLATLCDLYLAKLTDAHLRTIAEDMQPLADRARELWNSYIASAVGRAFQVFATAWGWVPIEPDLRLLGTTDAKEVEYTKDHLRLLGDLAAKAGVESIVILVDKVDESELTGNDASAAFRLIQPMVRDLDLLSIPRFGFKFFLWDKIGPHYIEHARPDRVKQYVLTWTRPQLKEMLQKRLLAYSENRVGSLTQITETLGTSPDDLVVAFSQRSPRNAVRICEKSSVNNFGLLLTTRN